MLVVVVLIVFLFRFIVCHSFSFCYFFFCKQKTAYEMRISDWSSDVCSSDLAARLAARKSIQAHGAMGYTWEADLQMYMKRAWALDSAWGDAKFHKSRIDSAIVASDALIGTGRSEEHTSELQSLMRISYDVFCLIKNIVIL